MRTTRITSGYIRVRFVIALSLIVAATVGAFVLSYANRVEIQRKAAIADVFDQILLEVSQTTLNLSAIAASETPGRAKPFQNDAGRSLRNLVENLKVARSFEAEGALGEQTAALVANQVLDPLGLLSDFIDIATPLTTPDAAFGAAVATRANVGIEIGKQLLPLFTRMKVTEREGLSDAIQMVDDLSAATLFATLGLVAAVGFAIFLPLEQKFLAAQTAAETERRAAEDALEAKSEFLAVMSHEIRTPLNGVLGMAEILRTRNLEPDNAALVDVIQSSGASLLGILNDILDFSKADAGMISLEEIWFDPADVAEDGVSLFSGEAARKGVELKWVVLPDTPILLRGDEARVRQIVANLLSNAIKFTEAGEVILRLSPLRGLNNAVGGAVIEVQDTGVGMTEDQADRVFHAFEQADRSTTRRFGGTGLGLSIVEKFVSLMGGKVSVTSALGVGSTFRVELPGRHISNRPRADRRVVLLGDDPDGEFVEPLARLGVDATAHPAIGALTDAIRRSPVDVIFIDADSLTTDWGVALEEIRDAEFTEARPPARLIFLKSESAPAEIARGVHVVNKPLRLEVIVPLVPNGPAITTPESERMSA